MEPGRNKDWETCDIMCYDKDVSVEVWLVCFLNFVWLVSHDLCGMDDWQIRSSMLSRGGGEGNYFKTGKVSKKSKPSCCLGCGIVIGLTS